MYKPQLTVLLQGNVHCYVCSLLHNYTHMYINICMSGHSQCICEASKLSLSTYLYKMNGPDIQFTVK